MGPSGKRIHCDIIGSLEYRECLPLLPKPSNAKNQHTVSSDNRNMQILAAASLPPNIRTDHHTLV